MNPPTSAADSVSLHSSQSKRVFYLTSSSRRPYYLRNCICSLLGIKCPGSTIFQGKPMGYPIFYSPMYRNAKPLFGDIRPRSIIAPLVTCDLFLQIGYLWMLSHSHRSTKSIRLSSYYNLEPGCCRGYSRMNGLIPYLTPPSCLSLEFIPLFLRHHTPLKLSHENPLIRLQRRCP